MKRNRFTEEQIIGILKEHELGAKTADLRPKAACLKAQTSFSSCSIRSSLWASRAVAAISIAFRAAMSSGRSAAFGNCTTDGHQCNAGVAFKYAGRWLDPETGLYYYRARYYTPTLGRFLQTDPVGYKDDINPDGIGIHIPTVYGKV